MGAPTLIKGDWATLPTKVKDFIKEYVRLCQPMCVFICDGSQHEADMLTHGMIEQGILAKLHHYDNCFLCRTDPADVARVESKTFIITPDKYTTVPHVKEGVKGVLGQWMSPDQYQKEAAQRYPGCMRGRIMYVLPFSMGPVGGPLSKIGVQLTDSNYVVMCMRVMTRVSSALWTLIAEGKPVVYCVHSVGCPKPLKRQLVNDWPCNPEKILITHFPDERKITSFGSGYGGNSLLGKKCFALRIASRIAKDEGWLAEHMLISSVTNPKGEEKFFTAAFPSACGKTNMAMMKSGLPDWNVQCVGDDIAWMRFNDKGELRAINPEAGFFGVAPGTNNKTNPVAMKVCEKNTIFTNVAMSEDGRVFWEGLEKDFDPNIDITTWLGKPWHIGEGGKAAQPNSRFCAPARQCPIIHSKWEDPEGVPVSAIIFGGRRPEGVPLVVESFSWEHGIMLGAALKSETTSAAEFKGKNIMHDPMAMRPFMGYNFGDYLRHWLSLKKPEHKLPRIFHVNWFRVDDKGQYLWPGFGENVRVVEWIMRRVNGEEGIGVDTPIGIVPKKGSINMDGLGDINWDELFSIPKDYWIDDVKETQKYLDDQVGIDLPPEIQKELDDQAARISAM